MNAEQTEEALALRQTRSWAEELREIATLIGAEEAEELIPLTTPEVRPTDLVVGVGKATNPGTGCEVAEMAKETSGASKTLTL